MKINWILPEPVRSGGMRVAFEYANELTKLGHDVVCYVPKSGQHWGWKKIAFFKDIIRYYIGKYDKGDWFNKNFKVFFPVWIDDNTVRDADIVIATSWITSYWVSELDLSKGKKVYFIQGFETWGSQRINDAVKASYKLDFDLRITVSTNLKNRLLVECGSDSKVLCNSVESCFLADVVRNVSGLTIGMPYREGSVKNCKHGLQVLNIIKNKYDVRIKCFGFKKPDLWNDDFLFVENPTRKELVEYYNTVNILYVPSLYEGWGLPAMEAMAQACCVVSGDSGIISEFGIDGENCIKLNNPLDCTEAVERIGQLIECEEDIRRIGTNARNLLLGMSYEENTEKFVELIQDLL